MTRQNESQRVITDIEEQREWWAEHPQGVLALHPAGIENLLYSSAVNIKPRGIDDPEGSITISFLDAVETSQEIGTFEISNEEAVQLAHHILDTVDGGGATDV